MCYACLTGAITRDPETRMISVDEEKCIGCCTCMLVCPLGAIKQDKEHKKMIKCDFCQGEENRFVWQIAPMSFILREYAASKKM
jgi:carbon-monoxide dehydrogenase iron sulfur subunit